MEDQKLHVPLSERLKSITGVFGFHLNEQPKYTLLKEEGDFELREYDPMLTAKITIQGSFEQAKEKAFLRLASYIFGENHDQKVFAMTSPVLIDFKKVKGEDAVTMSFILPSEISGKTAPMPNDTEIHLQQIPEQTWAVLAFSGRNTLERLDEKSQELQSWVMANGQKIDVKTLQVAQYDGPSTIPMFRRNEIWLRLWSDKIH